MHLIQVREPCHIRLELQLHCARRAVALLADDAFGQPVHLVHILLPLKMFRRALGRFAPRDVIFLAEDEHDDVGVLLDGARLAQIR